MSSKRGAADLDPDYEGVTDTQSKRQRLIEADAKEATKRKIETVIRREFMTEIHHKERELATIDQRLSEARLMLDRLRACIVANFYGSAGQTRASQRKPTAETMCIHPTVKKNIIGKAPVGNSNGENSTEENFTESYQNDLPLNVKIKQEVVDEPEETVTPVSSTILNDDDEGGRGSRFKLRKRIIVGNLSKYIPVDKREDNDPSTHKWMLYVRGSKDKPRIDDFISKVWFFLHPSYRPNDLVEISTPPFHLTRRGWGEFPVRIQLHFKDGRNKKVDLIHHLKLDRTYTGLQTLGAETHVDIEIERENPEQSNKDTCLNGENQGNVLLSFKDCLKKDAEQRLKDSNAVSFENDSGISLSNGIVSPRSNVTISHCDIDSGKEKNIPVVDNLSNVISQNKVQSPKTLSSVPMSPSISSVTSASNSPRARKHSDTSVLKSPLTPGVPLLSNVACTVPTTTATVSQSPVATAAVSPGTTGLVYVRCVDNQGKIYLIPQHLIPQLTGLQSACSPKKITSPGKHVLQTNAVSPVKSIVHLPASSSPLKTQKISIPEPKSNLSSFQNSLSLLRPPKNNSLKTTATVSVTKAAGETGLLTLNTITSPTKCSTQNVNSKDIKVSAIAGCPRAKQPLIFLTQNSQKSVSLLQPGIAPLGKTTTLIGGMGGISLIQPSIPLAEPAKDKPNKTLTEQKLQNSGKLSSGTNFVISGASKNVSNLATTQTLSTNVSVRLKSPSTQLVIKGSSLLNPSISNTISLKTGSSNTVPTSRFSPPSTSSYLKTGTTVLLNKGLPISQSFGTSPAVQGPNKLIAAAPSLSQNAVVDSKTSLKPHQTVVATIGNQHYLLQLIPGQDNNKMALSNDTSTSQVTKNLIGQNSVTKPLICQRQVNMNIAPSLTVSPNSSFSNVKISPNMNSSAHFDSSSSSVFMNPNHLPKSGHFKPVQLTSKYCRKRDRGDGDVSLLSQHRLGENKTRVILGKKNKAEQRSDRGHVNIRLENISDMTSLVKSVMKHYPLVCPTIDRSDHPYCARVLEDWLKWNAGKRRASEWQRASCVRQHIVRLIDKSDRFKEEELWSIKHIVNWCRLHAFSPHYLEKDRGSSEPADRDTDLGLYTSYSTPSDVYERLNHLTASTSPVSDEEEIDIISLDVPVRRIKTEVTDVGDQDEKVSLPVTHTAHFVQELSQKVGIRFSPIEIEPGVTGSITEDLIYTAMQSFMEDILRQSFASSTVDNRYPEEIKVADIFEGLCSLKITDFLTNQYCGTPDTKHSNYQHR